MDSTAGYLFPNFEFVGSMFLSGYPSQNVLRAFKESSSARVDPMSSIDLCEGTVSQDFRLQCFFHKTLALLILV
jgi:hypothetical protein